MVLIARLDDGRTLYAVEREDRGLYILCQLGSWINLQQLRNTAVASKQDISKCIARNTALSTDGAMPLVTHETSKYSKKKRLAIEAIQSMVKRTTSSLLNESQPAASDQDTAPESQQGPAAPVLPIEDVVTQPTSVEIFETVRNQYFEALYLSKVTITLSLLDQD